ncbi:MAG: AsmA family protein [Acidiferrobacterales bacterium]|nr:AsmA family protein [Acidiferrobacterales bacterium]
MFAIKLVKWIFGLVLTLGVLILLAVLIIPRVFEPNDYRDQISELVQEKTGRELQLNGDLSVSVFPWLGIRTQGLSLSQPPEIGGAMVQVETAQLRLKLMPLLSKRVEIDTVILEQPQLKFITLENGTNSLTGLTDSAESPEEGTEQGSPENALALVIQGVELTDGSLEWDDRQAKQRYQINDLQLITGNLIGDSLADLELSGTLLDLSDPSVQAVPLVFSLNGEALIDTDTLLVTAQNLAADIDYAEHQANANIANIEFDSNSFNLDVAGIDVDLESSVADQAVQANATVAAFSYDLESSQIGLNTLVVDADYGGQDVQLNMPSVAANLDKQIASIAKTELNSDDLRVSINNLEATRFIDNPLAKGSLEIPKFNAAALLDRFDIDYQASDSDALTGVSLSTLFSAGLDQVELSNIKFTLDNTNLSGEFAARDFSQLAVDFDLVLDSIELDRYLPESADETTSASDDSVNGADALAVPMAFFKDINANGNFRADRFVSSGVELTDINVKVESTPGRVAITPNAELYDGELAGSMVYTEQGDVSQLTVKNKIGVVDLAKFLTAADVSDQLSGFGTVDLDVTVTERNGVQSNEGTIKLFAQDGAVQGIDIKNMIDQAYSTYQTLAGKESVAPQEGESEQDDATGFAELLGTFNLKDYNLSNNDFSVNAPFFRIAGSGDIDLAAQNLDYTLNVAIVKSAAGQGGAAVDELDGLTLPIRLQGSLLAPSYSLDTKALYQSLAKAKVEEKKSEFVQEKLGIETDGEVSTKDILRGLLEKEIADEDEAPVAAEPSVAANQEAAVVSDPVNQVTTEPEPELTEEEQQEKDEDELEDELKNKLLDSLFN